MDVRMALRGAAERLALAARARPCYAGFARSVTYVCEHLSVPALASLSATSRSMAGIARADHVWTPLTADRFPEGLDLPTPVSGGFRAFSRLAQLWFSGSPVAKLKRGPAPGADAYSMLLTFKYDKSCGSATSGVRRVTGGLFDISTVDVGASIGLGVKIDLRKVLAPPALARGSSVS